MVRKDQDMSFGSGDYLYQVVDNWARRPYKHTWVEVADVAAVVGVDMIEVFGVGEPAIEREIAGDVALDRLVDQFTKHFIVIVEGLAAFGASFALHESAKVKRIMLAAGADVVGDEIVVGNFVSLLGVVPEIADILDAFADVIDERIVDGDDAVGAVASRRFLLQPVQPLLIQLLNIPIRLGHPSIQTRLIGGVSELTVNLRDVLVLGDEQPGKILGEVFSLGLIGEVMAKDIDCLVDHGGKFDDGGHDRILHDPVLRPASPIYRQNAHEFAWKN